MSQLQRIKQALERGEVLTGMDILRRFNCMNYKGRISDLRINHNMPIPHDHKVKLPSGKRIAIYYDTRLKSPEIAEKTFYARHKGITPVNDYHFSEGYSCGKLANFYGTVGSIRKVAEKFGLSYGQAREELIREGVDLNKQGRPHKQLNFTGV